MRLFHRALVAHYLDGTCHFVRSRHEIVHIYICLETDLPVAEKHEIVTFTICLVAPFADVVALGTLPFVVAAPSVGVGIPLWAPCQTVGFHVAGVIGSVVPECADVGRVVRLPVVIHFHNHVQNFGRLLCVVG